MRIANKRRQSRLSLWSRRTGFAAIPVLFLTAIGHRSDFFDAAPTLALLAIGLTLAVSAVLAGIGGFAAIWREGRTGFRAAAIGLTLGLALLSYPAFLLTRLVTLPAIADVTTNPEAELDFAAIRWDHPTPSDGVLRAQLTAYPSIQSHIYAADPEIVFEEVRLAVEVLGWTVYRQESPHLEALRQEPIVVSPSPGPAQSAPLEPAAIGEGGIVPPAEPTLVLKPGFVEATARTLVVGFREDIIIRVGTDPAGAIVDVRSASRHFRHDFGSNAARIIRLYRELNKRLARATFE